MGHTETLSLELDFKNPRIKTIVLKHIKTLDFYGEDLDQAPLALLWRGASERLSGAPPAVQLLLLLDALLRGAGDELLREQKFRDAVDEWLGLRFSQDLV